MLKLKLFVHFISNIYICALHIIYNMYVCMYVCMYTTCAINKVLINIHRYKMNNNDRIS